MPESNGDPPPSHLEPEPEPSQEGVARPAPLTPAPRANPPSVFNPKDAPPPPQAAMPAGFSEFVAWMQSFSAMPPPPPAAPHATEGRTLLPKEQKKFHKFDPETQRTERGIAVGNAHDEAAPSVVGNAETPRTRRSVPLPAPEPLPVVRRRRAKATATEAETTFQVPWRLLMFAGLLAGSFVLGRKTVQISAQNETRPVSRATPDPGENGKLIDGLFDQAMEAESAGDFRRATNLLTQARQKGSHAVGIDYQLALLAFGSGEFPHAMSLLDHSLDAGEEPAACYNLRGLLNNRTGGVTRGLTDLETATRLDPFNARYFFMLGEALRRSGKPQAALASLMHAKDRLNEPELAGLYGLKIRLTQIELGQDNEFGEQLADELRRSPPSMDWLLTAAALEMHRGHLSAAASYLDKVSALADARTLNTRLRDYYFFAFADEPVLARFYAGLRSADAAGAAAPPSAKVPAPPVSSAGPAPAASPETSPNP